MSVYNNEFLVISSSDKLYSEEQIILKRQEEIKTLEVRLSELKKLE